MDKLDTVRTFLSEAWICCHYGSSVLTIVLDPPLYFSACVPEARKNENMDSSGKGKL